ncbi:MAG TPA: glycine betaine ABC transporter substrate-binding protein [Solirubrobacteraceae bacterium]|jgi:osmoprotectant transport system substrate-binding protein
MHRCTRGISLILAVTSAVVLAACGSSTKSNSSTSSSASTPAGSTAAATPAAASSGPGVGKPAVTIGDKNFPEENIIGALYAQALGAKGYKVTLKDNIGSSEITYKALTSGQIDMYPEYTGVLLSAIAGQTKNPTSAVGAYAQAKAYVEQHGLTLLSYTPFYDSDALATLPAYARQNHLTSVGDLKKLGKQVKLGGAPEFATRVEGLVGLKNEYGVNPTFTPIAINLSYQALDSKQVDAQDVFTTDGQLLGGKYKLLADPKHVFGFQNVAPVVKQSVLVAEGPAFKETLNKVNALLTFKAIQQMNAAVSIDKQSAASVAQKFLQANGLG